MTERLLTARQVAEFFDVTPETVLRWRRERGLPFVLLTSRAIRFRESDLDAWIEQRAAPGTQEAGCNPTPLLSQTPPDAQLNPS
jgi:excisionase family DNA binding protein